MTPGLARGPPFPENATTNAVVAIASTENPSVPKVVGICEIDVSSLTQVQGAKGHAVRSEHWEGDELWAWSLSGTPGGAAPVEIAGWMCQDTDTGLSQEVKSVALEDNDEEDDGGGVPLENKPELLQQIEPYNEYVEGEEAEGYKRVEEEELSPKGRLTSAEYRGWLLTLQKLTMHFGKHSYMLFTTAVKQRKARSTMVFRFLFPRRLSCQI